MKKYLYLPILFSLMASFLSIQAMEEPTRNTDSNTINISGLPLRDVVVVLYNNATGTGNKTAALMYLQSPHLVLTREQAQAYTGLSIDYINGRKMALKFDPMPVTLSLKGYNDNHGPNRGQGTIEKLRALLASNPSATEDDLRQKCYFSVWEQVLQESVRFHEAHKGKLPTDQLIAQTYEIQDSIKKDADTVGSALAQAQDELAIQCVYGFADKLSNCGNRGNQSQNRFQVYAEFLGMNPQNSPKQPQDQVPQQPQRASAPKSPAAPPTKAVPQDPVAPKAPAAIPSKAPPKKQVHSDNWARGMYVSKKDAPNPKKDSK